MSTQIAMSFVLSAVLGHEFRSAFNNAGKMMEGLGKQVSALEKNQGQIAAFQKMQGTLAQSAEKLNAARMKVKSIGQEMKASSVPSAALKQAFANANIEAHRLETRLTSQRKELGSLRTQLKEAGIDTKNLTSEQARLASQSDKVAAAQKKISDAQAAYNAAKQRTSWDNIKGDLAASAAGVMALKVPVSVAMNFEQAMSGVEAVSFGGKAETEGQKAALEALKNQALELGSTTQFTAMQAAQSQENLARAGFTSSQILKAMPGLLDMAAAEGMDLASAASIASDTLRGFNMEAGESGFVADVLAKTSAMSNTNIAELGEAMKYVAPLASDLGVSIGQTSALMAAMANNGIKSSQAGTALRSVFTRLSKEPKAVAKALSALGVASRDSKGNMRTLPSLLEAISKKTKGMGTAQKEGLLANIFGTEAVSAMAAVMKAVEKGDIANFEEALKKENVTGTAKAMAKAKTDNLAGDITALSSAWEGLNETIGSAFTPILRDITKSLTGLVSGANALAKKFPTITKYAVRLAGMFVLKKSILTGFRIGKDLLSIPILAGKVANATLEVSAATGKLTLTQKAAYAFMKVNQWLWDGAKLVIYKGKTLLVAGATKLLAGAQWILHGAMKAIHSVLDVGKLALYHAKTLVISAATKAWTAIQWGWNAAMGFGHKLLDIGKLILYYGKVALVTAATKGWVAIQWAWNAAMSSNPIGLIIIGVGALIAACYALYKNWDKIKQFGIEMWDSIQKKVQAFADWWDSWTLKDVFAPLTEWFDNAINYIKGKWDEFCSWLAGFNPFSSWSVPDTPEMKAKVEIMGRQGAVNDRALDMAFGAPQGIPGHALGGIITHPMISWLAEDGPEAVVPLENRSRGIPLWLAAGERMGLRFGGGNTTNTSYIGGSPTINITVSGGGSGGNEQSLASRIAQAVRDALSDIQSYEERVAFA